MMMYAARDGSRVNQCLFGVVACVFYVSWLLFVVAPVWSHLDLCRVVVVWRLSKRYISIFRLLLKNNHHYHIIATCKYIVSYLRLMLQTVSPKEA